MGLRPILPYKGNEWNLINYSDTAEFVGTPCGTTACFATTFYPASVFYDKKNTGQYILAAKSYRKIWRTTSPNGIYDPQLKEDYEIIAVSQGAGTPTEGGIETNLIRYDDINKIYHFYFGGIDILIGSNIKKQIFHGTATDPTTNSWTIDYVNPVISVGDLPATAPNGESTADAWMAIGDMKVLPDGSHLYYVAISHLNNFFGHTFLATFTSPADDWTNITFDRWLFGSEYLQTNDLHTIGTTRNWIQKVTVVKYYDKYVMMFNHGNDGAVRDQRWIYCAVGDTPFDFEFIKDPVLVCGPDGGQTSLRVYNPEWLIEQSYEDGYWKPEYINGNMVLYYSGVDVGEVNNSGQTHRVEFDRMPNFVEMDKIAQQVI